MKKILALAVPLLLTAWSARADLIWYEGFQYTNGSITTNSAGLWARESGTAAVPGDLLVNHSNLEVSATGGTVTRQDDCDRLFTLTPHSPYTNSVQLVYASFTLICTNLPNGPGSYFASFYNTGPGYCGRVQAFTNGTILPKTFRLGVTDNVGTTNPPDGGFPVDLALNTAYQVVEELDPITLEAASIWINPINLSDTGAGSSDPVYTAKDSIGYALTNQVNAYAFRQASSFGNVFFQITNLAIATTFAEAVTNVWSTNAVPPSIVYQPVGFTNYVGNPVSLSGLANGQGLGNLTYQWQQNGVNYTGGNGGTANILIISTAQSSDSGSYTLIATTPYGLSVTSSPVTVFISTAAVPPTFITQPVNQLAYSGQSVTFSTSVISPDINNVSYQWQSNGVAIPGANSSTLTLTGLTTNESGALISVGVTNDVTPNGIVSSNAVLTVLNPQIVSIAYLRTLVNPSAAYAATNTPPTIPYQVTGIVTTYTNITGGNTFSYYLQDGTAGINIFATFGSTFRPAQGDVITYIGVVSSFAPGGLELYADTVDLPYTSYTDLSNNIAALPAPISIPFTVTNTANIPFVNTNLAGSLVKLSDCHFGTNSGVVISTTANVTLQVTNSSGQKFNLAFFDLDQDTAGKTLPTYAFSVSGVLYGINTNFSVAVTRFSDIVTSAPSAIPLSETYTAGTLGFTWSDASFVLQTSTNVVGPYTTVTGATSGFTTNTTSGPTRFYRLFNPL